MEFRRVLVRSRLRDSGGKGAGLTLPTDLRDLAAQVSNWGRWGEADEIGTLNLVDDAAVQRGVAAAARGGARIPLAIRLDANGPQMGNIPGRANPLHTMAYRKTVL